MSTPDEKGPEDLPVLDTCGLLCPLPVLKTRKRLKDLPVGTRLKVLADDPAALIDIPHFCAEQGHSLDGEPIEGDSVLTFVVVRGR
ncbi:MAG: sulfurtransferase TusA family protein [Paracoccaceae bacterium]